MSSDTLSRLLRKLDDSQWWTADQIEQHQFRQLQSLAAHIYEHVPFQRDRLEQCGLTQGRPWTAEAWRRLPVMTRYDLQEAGEALHSPVVPEGHVPVVRQLTSGSTGTPVETLATGITGLFWRAATLRDHLWHQRDFGGKLASIRYLPNGGAEPPRGLAIDNWGTATQGVFETGPGAILSVFSTTAEQATWLAQENPDYLMIYPSALETLLNYCAPLAERPSRLREVRTFGEVVDSSLRELSRRVWDVPIRDVYSCQEAGHIALQCPENEHYHVQAEDLMVEVLTDDDEPCRPGETGRVVVTTLHNFAMPLLRYELGDYAEVGETCSCGRGLPVLKRILGRTVSMFTLPGGDHVWPSLDLRESEDLMQLPVRQYQVIQRDTEHVDAYLVVLRALTADEEAVAVRSLQRATRYPFRVTFHYVDEIERSPSGKYDEFRSLVR